MLGKFLGWLLRRSYIFLHCRFRRSSISMISIRRFFTSPRAPAVIGSSVFLVLCVLTYFVDPNKVSLFPPCPFAYFTGLYCPGCGSLRSLHSLLHADFLRALSYNPLLVLSLPVFLFLTVRDLQQQPNRTFFDHPKFILVLVLFFFVVRNVDLLPLTMPSP